MHVLTKVLFIFASAVTAIVVGAFFFVGLVGHSENTTFALGWLSIAAIGFWIPVASVLILLMAITTKVGQAKLIGKRSVIEWGILVFLLYLAAYLINSSYLSVWRGLTDGWYSSPVWPMLTLWAGLAVLVSSVALLLRHRWSLQLILLAAIALFVRSNYETLGMYSAMPFTAFLVSAGIKNFAAMIVLASYIYIRKKALLMSYTALELDAPNTVRPSI